MFVLINYKKVIKVIGAKIRGWRLNWVFHTQRLGVCWGVLIYTKNLSTKNFYQKLEIKITTLYNNKRELRKWENQLKIKYLGLRSYIIGS